MAVAGTAALRSWWRAIRQRWQTRPLLARHLAMPGRSQPRRALLSYLTAPLRDVQPDDQRRPFSNAGLALTLPRLLQHMGYVVDIVDCSDTWFKPTRHYELFIGHGAHNFERLAAALPASATKVYFATGSHWQFHNRSALARAHWLAQRRGTALPPDRPITVSEERANQLADGIVCLGSDAVRATYAAFARVVALNSAAFPAPAAALPARDFTQARRHFLFFAGAGNLHKGLDLLLEAFDGADASLWICQPLSPGFERLYRHELNALPNVHHVGWLSHRSAQFYALAARCAYVILPSCSEGSPGSVIECLHAGLIPVLSPEAGIDVADFGVALPTTSIADIRLCVDTLAAQPAAWCQQQSERTLQAAASLFSVEAFSRNMVAAIARIVADKAVAGQAADTSH